MSSKVQMQVTAETRAFIAQNVKVGDWVRITMSLDDNYCEHCDYDIGIDDGMFESEGEWLHVTRVTNEYSQHLQCNAQVVEARHYLWSTCWMSEVVMHRVPVPSWEL